MTRAIERLLAAAYGLLCRGPQTRRCTTFKLSQPPDPAGVTVTFLGVGGFLIDWAGETVMTPPLYSNPTMGEVVLSDIHSDTERIDRFLHFDLSNLKAIIVGHAHYDHALDIPYIAWKKVRGARIYGSQTLLNVLEPLRRLPGANNPFFDAEARALCKVTNPVVDPCPCRTRPCPGNSPPCDPKQSFLIGNHFRLWPIVSEHSAPLGPGLLPGLLQKVIHFDPVTGWRGQLLSPATEFPTRVGNWTCGTTLSYVIDLLDGGSKTPVFRIYYQDSPTRKPIGYPPCCLIDERRIDLALLCVGGATALPDFPGDIVRTLQPRFVIGSHWEDLFKPRTLPVPSAPPNVQEEFRTAPGVNLKQFIHAVRAELPAEGYVNVPCPEETTRFVRDAQGKWRVQP